MHWFLGQRLNFRTLTLDCALHSSAGVSAGLEEKTPSLPCLPYHPSLNINHVNPSHQTPHPPQPWSREYRCVSSLNHSIHPSIDRFPIADIFSLLSSSVNPAPESLSSLHAHRYRYCVSLSPSLLVLFNALPHTVTSVRPSVRPEPGLHVVSHSVRCWSGALSVSSPMYNTVPCLAVYTCYVTRNLSIAYLDTRRKLPAGSTSIQ